MVIEMTAAKRPPTLHENMTEELVEKIKVINPSRTISFQNLCYFNEIQDKLWNSIHLVEHEFYSL